VSISGTNSPYGTSLLQIGTFGAAGKLCAALHAAGELVRILNPKIMMLDEPFRGLDAMTRE
jgi:ABC-type uncharacterized transport system YnjBCD ATPase subunit